MILNLLGDISIYVVRYILLFSLSVQKMCYSVMSGHARIIPYCDVKFNLHKARIHMIMDFVYCFPNFSTDKISTCKNIHSI